MKKSVDKDNEKKTDKTRQEIDREKLDKKFSKKSKEKLNWYEWYREGKKT